MLLTLLDKLMIAQLTWDYIKTRPCKTLSRLASYALFEGRPVTTKGRWINPLVFSLFAIEKKLPLLKKVDRPIFIAGSGRSGTTILGVLLSIHKSVGYLNEPKAMWHSIFPGEDVIGSYSKQFGRYQLTWEDVNDETKHNAHKLFGAYSRLIFCDRVVDKYPEHIFRIDFVRQLFPDAKIIFLVRNGWDTCVSIDTWSKRLGQTVGNKTHDWWGVNQQKWQILVKELVPQEPLLESCANDIAEFEDHLNMAAVEWIVTMQKGRRELAQYAQCIKMVKYEDLAAEPVDTLRQLLKFCELPDDEILINYSQRQLETGRSHSTFVLHEPIALAFHQTMRDLGYE